MKEVNTHIQLLKLLGQEHKYEIAEHKMFGERFLDPLIFYGIIKVRYWSGLTATYSSTSFIERCTSLENIVFTSLGLHIQHLL